VLDVEETQRNKMSITVTWQERKLRKEEIAESANRFAQVANLLESSALRSDIAVQAAGVISEISIKIVNVRGED
jgi:hypothetical protein